MYSGTQLELVNDWWEDDFPSEAKKNWLGPDRNIKYLRVLRGKTSFYRQKVFTTGLNESYITFRLVRTPTVPLEYHEMKFVNVPKGSVNLTKDLKVNITKPFEIMTAPVTQSMWTKVKDVASSSWNNIEGEATTGYMTKNGQYIKLQPDYPADGNAHTDIDFFISGLNSKKDGYFYRLPTEAEMKHVIGLLRKKDGTSLNLMDKEEVMKHAWVAENSDGRTHAVGTTSESLYLNGVEVYDMLGNVSIPVKDNYYSGTYPEGEFDDWSYTAKGPLKYRYLAIGGSYKDASSEVATKRQLIDSIVGNYAFLGLRVVREKVK